MNSPLQILKKYYTYTSFRPLQEQIINAVLNGFDTLAILPTGGGKSLCFQVPTLCLNGVCLVISPLIALMNDQVENLQKKNISAISFSGNIDKDAQKIILNNIKNRVYSFIYISPEKLSTHFFQNFIQDIKISLVAIDEAHCISQFGHLFRPSYRELNIIKKILPNTPILALTASATKLVQQDIIQQLNLSNVSFFKSSFDRPNVSYSCFFVEYKMNKILDILNKIKGSSLIYCNTRNQTTEIANLLKLQNFSAVGFHAGLNDEVKKEIQKNWVDNKISTIVCTSAFGMGIDKPDVRTVIHYSPPDCLENYYQEAGRAGRDQLKSFAVLLYNKEDIKRLNELATIKFPNFDIIKKVYTALCNYLKIPVGMGAKMSFYFDIDLFCKTFKLEKKITIQCLLFLEKEGHLNISKKKFVKSTIQFLINKNDLINYETTNPTLKIIILCLLRTYSKILDSNVEVDEKKISNLIKKDETEIIEKLTILHNLGIILYNKKQHLPQIEFVWNRSPINIINFNLNNYTSLKRNYLNQLNSFIQYISNINNVCRSQFISFYFDDRNAKVCGICDICIKNKKKILEKKIYTEIMTLVNEKNNPPIFLETIISKSSTLKKAIYWKIIKQLQAENKIKINELGNIIIIK